MRAEKIKAMRASFIRGVLVAWAGMIGALLDKEGARGAFIAFMLGGFVIVIWQIREEWKGHNTVELRISGDMFDNEETMKRLREKMAEQDRL